MLLYFLRHGDAVQTPSFTDSERPLSTLGRQQAETVGNFLHSSNTTIDRIVSSPLARTVETAQIVGRVLGVQSFEHTEYLVPGTRKKQLLDLINTFSPNSVLLVGHAPHLSQTVSLLLSDHEGIPIEFGKCSLASIIASEPVRSGHALLQWLVPCEHMELLQRR